MRSPIRRGGKADLAEQPGPSFAEVLMERFLRSERDANCPVWGEYNRERWGTEPA